MAEAGFVHLHVHSSYSLLEGALTIARLAELAKADRQPALALTDTDNMFGALEFSDKMAAAGIQPIVGCALAVDFADQETGPRAGSGPAVQRPRIVLLAARENGYRSLMRLNSRAFLDTPPNEQPHLELAWLEGETDGLIALTGGPGGPLDAAIGAGQSASGAMRAARRWQRLFGDRLYIELQRHGSATERAAEPALVELAYARGIPLVAANEPLFRARGRLRGARRADLHRRRAAGRRDRPTPADPRAPLQDPRGNGRVVCRPARGGRLDGRDRAALRVPARTCRSRSCRASRSAKRRYGRRGGGTAPACRGRARAPASRRSGSRRRPHDRGIPRAPRLRARRDRAHEISRLLPDRRRTSSSGRRRRAFRSDRAAAPARARSSPTALTITDLDPMRFGLICSSASSIPSASRCPTSTSTSARTGATR